MRITLALTLALTGCTGMTEPDTTPDPSPASEPLRWRDDVTGVVLELSDADPPRAGGAGTPAAVTTPMSDADVAALLGRVEGLDLEDGDRETFAFRPATKPPPRTGATIETEFPAAGSGDAPAVETGPLTVLRHAPDGAVPMAPHLSLTFSQPMIALTSQDEAAKVRPLTLTPEPDGQWRWLGTKTILFEPDPFDAAAEQLGHTRFPMATTYTVTVPKGTESATGGTLADAVTFTFSTPPVTRTSTWPSDGPHDVQPLLFMAFDQRIDEAAIASHVTLWGGSKAYPVRLATDDEIERDRTISALIDGSAEHRFVVLRPSGPLAKSTSYTLSLPVGAPSAEGPLKTTGAQTSSFYTYAPLAFERQDCGSGLDGCDPDGWYSMEWNNPLNADVFDPAWVTVEPAVPGLQVNVSGDYLQLHGRFTPRTKHTVTVAADLTDTFGQKLGAAKKITFSVGGRYPSLTGPGKDMVVLDPAGPRAFPIWSTNIPKVRLRVFQASPDKYIGFSKWMREWYYDGSMKTAMPLELLSDTQITLEKKPDELLETPLDLSKYLPDGHGQLVVWVEPVPQPADRWSRTHIIAWVQSTELGLSLWHDNTDLLVWASKLANGDGVDGVSLSLQGGTSTATTDAKGLAALSGYASSTGPHVLVARKGTDVAILPEQQGWWNEYGGWYQTLPGKALRWYVFDDRHLYRPTETVSLKGWIRLADLGRHGDLGALESGPTTLTWTAYDAYGNQMGDGTTPISAAGAFDMTFALPGTPALGTCWFTFSASGGSGYGEAWFTHYFDVQEFRRPEYEVSASVADPGPHVLGGHAIVAVDAQYYSGGPLPDAQTEWEVNTADASFTPPGHDDYRFGQWTPWWWYDWRGGWGGGYSWKPPQTHSGRTDPLGTHRMRIDFVGMNPPRPTTVTAQATVIDVNRQRWSATETLLLHPADVYVGVKPDRRWYEAGDDIALDVIVSDIDGKLVAGREVTLTFARLEYKYGGGAWKEVEVDAQTCAKTSSTAASQCAFKASEGGNHRVKAVVTDAAGRKNETLFTVFVAGGKQQPSRGVDLAQITLVPDKDEYRPGDVAEILVQAPFHPAEGVWQLQRQGRVEEHVFEVTGASTILKVPIAEEHVPNVTIDVYLAGSEPRLDDKGKALPDKAAQPAHAAGSLSLPVPPATRTLKVEVTPRAAALRPGGKTTVDVKVRDASGKPVDAEVAVIAVDEAVLALAGYQIPDPLGVMYPTTWGGVSARHSRADLLLGNPIAVAAAGDVTTGTGSFGMLGGGGSTEGFAMADAPVAAAVPMEEKAGSKSVAAKPAERSRMSLDKGEASELRTEAGTSGGTPIAVRSDFSALALFAPRVTTGADGNADVELALPDSLTRYRVVAIAVSGGKQFGKGESTVTARLPIMLRPSPPRFLNFGDRAEVPFVVQNQTDAPLEVSLAAVTTNLTFLADLDATPAKTVPTTGRRFTVPANDRVEVRLPVATEMAGTARLQAVVATSDFADAAKVSLPVWTPATAEAFATYGELDTAAMVQPVKAPDDVWPQFGGLEITTSSTQLQALTDAFLYLVQYPFECNEQLASRLLAVAALRDVLDAFDADGLPPKEDIEAAVARDLERLGRRQHGNGGFSFWRGDDEDWPYPTVHVTHALVRAKGEGYAVDEDMLKGAMRYTVDVERHIPGWYSDEARWTIIAYALYVRHEAGDDDVARARKLVREATVKGLPFEALGSILPVLESAKDPLVAEILRHLENNVAETASDAHFVTSYADGAYVLLHSDRRVDGVILDSLVQIRPKHDLIPKLTRGLLAHRRAGAWSNTQENAFVLLAMHRYFEAYEGTAPDFVARAWLGTDYVGDHAFKGYSTDRVNTLVPMSLLSDPGGVRDLTLAKEGTGRLYYRLGLKYAPKSLELEAADRGFAVEREYSAIDDPADVRKDADGTWHVKAGARVRVRITMVAPARRYHVALIDPLPAGLEPLNPALATTGSVPTDPTASKSSGYWWWWGPWYQHQQMRDERVEAYTTLLWDGVHTYSYVATATTPGRFVVPPARAEEMYTPETFGRSATDRVIVE